jgi:hypothetical protein
MIENLITNAEAYLQIASYIIAAAAIIAAMTKNESDNVWVARIRKVIDVLAINVGNAKNEKSPK